MVLLNFWISYIQLCTGQSGASQSVLVSSVDMCFPCVLCLLMAVPSMSLAPEIWESSLNCPFCHYPFPHCPLTKCWVLEILSLKYLLIRTILSASRGQCGCFQVFSSPSCLHVATRMWFLTWKLGHLTFQLKISFWWLPLQIYQHDIRVCDRGFSSLFNPSARFCPLGQHRPLSWTSPALRCSFIRV